MASWVCSRNTAFSFNGGKIFSASKQKCFKPRFLASSSENPYHVISSPTLVATEYADLNLSLNLPSELSNISRIRQHVNPLRLSLSKAVQVPDWNQVFRDPALPLTVDIGSGGGRFLLWLAKRDVGLVKRAQHWVHDLNLNNVHFLFANASNSFEDLVSTYPGPLTLVSILCPDPHFKKRHRKRRVVQKPLVESIAKCLMPGGQVFVQSDVFDVAVDMRDQFDGEINTLRHIDSVGPNMCNEDGWLMSNPMGIRTEREIHAESEGAKIYRRLYQKVTSLNDR